jgi:hypothetical protein
LVACKCLPEPCFIERLTGVEIQQEAASSALVPRSSCHLHFIPNNGRSSKELDHKKMEVSS